MMSLVDTASPPAHVSRHSRFRIAVVLSSVVAATVGSVVLVTRNSGEKVTTSGVTATLRVPSHPGWVAAGRDALWLALADAQPPVRDRPLLRLDLASGTVQRSFFPGGQASSVVHVGNRLLASVAHIGSDGLGPSRLVALDWRTGRLLTRRGFGGPVGSLAIDGKDLWGLQTKPGALLRLDPLTLSPTAAPLPLSEGRTLGLAVGAGYIWVTAADAGDVLRIDPARRTITRVHVGGFPVGIVVAGGSVWFADRERGEIFRRDPRTLRPLGDPVEAGEPSWLGAAGGYLFVGSSDAGTVTRIDVRSGKKAGPPIRVAQPAKGARALTVVPTGTSVWVSSFASNTLTRISTTAVAAPAPAATTSGSQGTSTVAGALPRGGRVVAAITILPGGSAPSGGGAFTVGEGAVWAMSDAVSTLMRIDPKLNAIVARIKVRPTEAAAAGNGAVWLSHPSENLVTRIDPRTNKVTMTIHVGPQPSGIAVSPGAVWVANAGGPSLSRIDPATNRVAATIRVGPARACCSEHMSVTTSDGAVWVGVPNGNAIVRVDPETNRATATVKLHFTPCGFLAADETAVWSAAATCGDVVGRIDARTNAPSGSVKNEPHAVGVALGFGSVWLASIDRKSIDRVDPRSNRIVGRLPVRGIPVRIGVGFGSVWVNDDTGRVLRIKPQG